MIQALQFMSAEKVYKLCVAKELKIYPKRLENFDRFTLSVMANWKILIRTLNVMAFKQG